MPLTINPCVFVGLGTTGLKILEELRRLFNEEFGAAGLPCFRYLVIETNGKAKADDDFLSRSAREFEKIDIKAITIRDISALEITPGMKSWLDPRLLENTQKKYETGAGHRRQAGRLCLWEHWTNVRKLITDAIEAVKAPASATESAKLLRENYFAKKHPDQNLPDDLVSNIPRAYIVGTFCGGTCSGTFLDIAYLFRRHMEVKSRSNMRDTGNPEIIGMFTVPNTIQVNDPILVANVASCWAALTELDFYSKNGSTYKVELPGEAPFETRDEPFTTVYLESMTNEGKIAFGKDEDGFHQMCAMNLFTEIVSGMAEVKAANRINYPASSIGFLKPNRQGHLQAFNCFGLSAVWYPRYRIAKALNRRLGEVMAVDWLGPDLINTGTVGTSAKADWDSVVDRARGSLLGSGPDARCPKVIGSIPNNIASLLDDRGHEFNQTGFDGLERSLLKFPGGEKTMAEKLSQNGEYYLAVNGVVPLVIQDLAKDLEERLVQYLRTHTLAKSREYSTSLINIAEAQEKSLPESLPVFSQKVDVSFASYVFDDLASKLLGLRSKAESEYKTQIWSNFRDRMMKHIKLFGDYFVKQAIKGVLGDIHQLDSGVVTARNNLTTFKNTCDTERKKELQVPGSSNIVIVSMGGVDPDISKDVDLCTAEISTHDSPRSLRERFLGNENPFALLKGNVSYLVILVDSQFAPLSQVEVNKFRIGTEAVPKLAHRIKSLVFSSASYFEPTSSWQQMNTPQSPNFIFCNDVDARGSLLGMANPHMNEPKYVGKETTLGHFVFFYQEKPGLAISDLQIAEYASRVLQDREVKEDPTEPTQYTHKLGRKMFDPSAMLTISKYWVEEATALAPELFRKVGEERFVPYRTNETSKQLYVDDDKNLQHYLLENGIESFVRVFVDLLKPLGIAELNKRMEKRKESALSRGDLDKLTNRHDEMLKAIFPPA